jgi:hypothetical protein
VALTGRSVSIERVEPFSRQSIASAQLHCTALLPDRPCSLLEWSGSPLSTNEL